MGSGDLAQNRPGSYNWRWFQMKIALVADWLVGGGAEKVVLELHRMFPDAPIYTAFYVKGSSAYERFKNRDIRVSWAHYIPSFAAKLNSTLRFLQAK